MLMPRSSSPSTSHRPGVHGWTRKGTRSSTIVPPPPPMQVVTKGWWVLRDEEASVEELERQDRKSK
jgi:hypothetical protein